MSIWGWDGVAKDSMRNAKRSSGKGGGGKKKSPCMPVLILGLLSALALGNAVGRSIL